MCVCIVVVSAPSICLRQAHYTSVCVHTLISRHRWWLGVLDAVMRCALFASTHKQTARRRVNFAARILMLLILCAKLLIGSETAGSTVRRDANIEATLTTMCMLLSR